MSLPEPIPLHVALEKGHQGLGCAGLVLGVCPTQAPGPTEASLSLAVRFLQQLPSPLIFQRETKETSFQVSQMRKEDYEWMS